MCSLDLPGIDIGLPETADHNAGECGEAAEVAIHIEEFIPLVRAVASRIYASIPPYAAIELNDLIQAGLLGLVNAGRSYQSSRCVPFAVYARFRIRGEILDSLRHIDTSSRRVRRMDKRIKAAKQILTASLQRDPTDGEVRKELEGTLGKSEIDVLELTLKLPPIAVTSLDDRNTCADTWRATDPGPESLSSKNEARQLLRTAIDRLPGRSRELIMLYYHGGLTMREIGARFSVNESRVSQIHRKTLERLARQLRAVGIGSAREI